MNQYIIEETISEHIVVLRLDRLDTFNAFNFDMLKELETQLDVLREKDFRVLILTGTGKSFSSGADLKELQSFDSFTARQFSLLGHKVLNKIENFPCPVLAAINGYALGGGCELACACDLRYASDTAKFSQPESKVGMITGWGGTFRLPRYIGVARAKELIFTGKIITAQEALNIGLVNAVFSQDQFLNNVLQVATKIAKMAPIANRLSKKMLNRYPHDVETLVNEEGLALAHCVQTEDQTEAINAFLQKREPIFKNK